MKFLRPAHKTRTLDPILSQINPFNVFTPCAFKVNSNSMHFKTRNVKLFPSRFLPLRCGLTALHLRSSSVILPVILKVW